MKLEEYESIVKAKSKKDNRLENAITAFISGGVLGVVAQLIFVFLYKVLNFTSNDSYIIVSLFFVILASVLTGLHVFDKIATTLKAGVIVPITGFAHSMTSAAIDYKKEGLINGIGSNIFKLAGSIILYGIVGAVVLAFIKGVIL